MRPDSGALVHIAFLLTGDGSSGVGGLLGVLDLKLLELGSELVLLGSIGVLGLLLLLFLHAQVESAILSGGGTVLLSTVLLSLDLLLLLFLQHGEVEATIGGRRGGIGGILGRRVGQCRILGGFLGCVDHGHGSVCVDDYLLVGESN